MEICQEIRNILLKLKIITIVGTIPIYNYMQNKFSDLKSKHHELNLYHIWYNITLI